MPLYPQDVGGPRQAQCYVRHDQLAIKLRPATSVAKHVMESLPSQSSPPWRRIGNTSDDYRSHKGLTEDREAKLIVKLTYDTHVTVKHRN